MSVEPHFHKDYRISEKDIVPDDSIYLDFPESAEEGRRIVVENPTGTFKFYQYVRGSWRAFAPSSGQTLLSYQHASSNSVTFNDLDLDNDKIYKIVVKTTDATSAAVSPALRINNDSSLKYYNHQTAGGAPSDSNQSCVVLLNSMSGSPSQFQSEILISKGAGDRPLLQYQTSGVNEDNPVQYPNLVLGSSTYDSTVNVTTLKFLYPDGTTVCVWDIWIYKLETS